MSFLTVQIIKKSHILAGIYLIFLKKPPTPNLKVLQYQIWTSAKRPNKNLSCKVNFNTFSQIIYLILGKNCVKDLRVTKIVKQVKIHETWSELKVKHCFWRPPRTKFVRKTLVFI